MQGGVLHVRSPILYTPTVGRSQPKLSARGKGRGALHAANPTHCNIPPMRVLGSARIPIVFLSEDCVHNITVRIVEGLPYGFILGARFFYANKSILNFGTDKGFKPTPASPWVPFLDKNMTASNPLAEARTTPLSRRRAQAVPNRYHRRERIGQRDHPGPGLRLPRPVLEGTVRRQIGRSCHDKRCTEWPEHTRTTLRDSTPNPSASVTFLVCNWPQQQARSLHSFFCFFLFFFSSDSKHQPVFGTVFLFFQQSVRPYVAIILTQMIDIQVM